jgi:hypothetical protein
MYKEKADQFILVGFSITILRQSLFLNGHLALGA